MDKITKLAISFINDHWNELNKYDLGLPKSKSKFIEELKKDKKTVSWVINEAMVWCLDNNYVNQYKIENENDDIIILIDGTYFKYIYGEDIYKEVLPKTKTVIYFD